MLLHRLFELVIRVGVLLQAPLALRSQVCVLASGEGNKAGSGFNYLATPLLLPALIGLLFGGRVAFGRLVGDTG